MKRRRVEFNTIHGQSASSRPRLGIITLYQSAELPDPVTSIYDLVSIEIPLSELHGLEDRAGDDRRSEFVGYLEAEAAAEVLGCLEELVELETLSSSVLRTFRAELTNYPAAGLVEKINAMIDLLDVLIAEADLRESHLAAEEAERQAILKFMASGKKPGFIYLLKAESGYWKIGCSRNPYNRIKTFSVKLPFDVEYEHIIPTNEMSKAETMLHKMFADKRVDGEWFALTTENVAWIKALKRLDM